MRILIVTYYKEINPGTFLQAYGVQYAMKKKFPNSEIEYLNYDFVKKESGSVGVIPSMSFISKMKHVIALKKRNIIFQRAQEKTFFRSKLLFSLFPKTEEGYVAYAGTFDLIVIGSDTILESLVIDNHIGIMWPSSKIKVPKIYFAASADSAKNLYMQDTIFPEIRKRVNQFNYIGLRDDVTIDFFKKYLEIEGTRIYKHPDPTYYLPLDLFSLPTRIAKKIKSDKKIIFYHFDRRFEHREELALLLKKQGFFLFTTEWDPNVNCSLKSLSPFEWAAVFKYCDFVITERFHDTVFSMRYNVPVITVDWNIAVLNDKLESKRLSVLKDFGCEENHVILKSKEDLHLILAKLDSIAQCYDKDKIKKVVDLTIERAYDLLRKVY